MTPADSANLVCLGKGVLHTLRDALERTLGDQAAPVLQEVGYTSGPEVYRAFTAWLRTRADVPDPSDLDAAFLGAMLSEFFHEAGWGTLTIERLGHAALAIDTVEWAEARPGAAAPAPSCHLTTGLLSAFMTELAGDVMAVMQVECLTCGDDRCRFLVGSPATLQQVFEAMTEGHHYSELLTSTP
jgi:predicted hydrocarbon binding protein